VQSDARGTFVTDPVVWSARDVDLEIYNEIMHDTLVRYACESNFELSLATKSSRDKKEEEDKTIPKVLKQEVMEPVVSWREKHKRMRCHPAPCHPAPERAIQGHHMIPWKEIRIQSITSGMILSNHTSVKIFLDQAPKPVTLSPLCKKMMEMPHVLLLYLAPLKNEASRMCPVAAKEHESNNIYFQFLFPVLSHCLNEQDKNFVAWTAQVLRILREGSMASFARLKGWPIMVRCFRDACSKSSRFYLVRWNHVLHLLEPMVYRMLHDQNYRKNATTQEMELAKIV